MDMGTVEQKLTELADLYYLECDGLTRVIHTFLSRHSIPHKVYAGGVIDSHNSCIPLHFWIDLEDGRRIDFRARMWLGDREDTPHGIFNPAEYPLTHYEGEVIQMAVLNDTIFRVLTTQQEDIE